MSHPYGVVIPSIGRPSLRRLLASLAGASGPPPQSIVVVDDRKRPSSPLDLDGAAAVVAGLGRGPAAARNRGWQQSDEEWVVFLDDDVEVSSTWCDDLAHDLEAAAARGAVASQGRVAVPLPPDRPANDNERGTAGLETARWITADFAVRRTALSAVGGFDERFPRAFREDADLGLRLTGVGARILTGSRQVIHPVRSARWHTSIAAQRGNRDDALMRRLHGPRWHIAAGAPVGRRPRHLGITASGLATLGCLAVGRRRAAAFAATAWLAGTAEFCWARIAPGPRDPAEVTRMLATSAVIPLAASWHWLAGLSAHRRARSWDRVRPMDALLIDRDGTLVRDVPYNNDPAKVQLLPAARQSLDRVRDAGLPIALVTNQSGVGRGLISAEELAAVHRKVERLLGPFEDWQVCPHDAAAACTCRKPLPGMVFAAAAKLGVAPHRMLMVGDIEADIAAARAAGALGMLVPNADTRLEEVMRARLKRATLPAAIDFFLDRPRA